MKDRKLTMQVAVLVAALVLALAACGESEPQERVFNLGLQGGELVQETSRLQVNQDDIVTLIVSSDVPVSFHLHGYDLEQEVEPGTPAEVIFTANATGSFPFTVHELAPTMAMDGVDSTHPSTVEAPEGMSVRVEAHPDEVSGFNVRLITTGFTFAPEEVNREPVPGHGHAHLYLDGVKLGRVYGEYYHVDPVAPGEHTLRATLNANIHGEYTSGHDVIEHAITITAMETAGGGHGHGDEQPRGPVDRELGRLEVQP